MICMLFVDTFFGFGLVWCFLDSGIFVCRVLGFE